MLATLDDGWTPHGLAGFTSGNTDSVRNPYAVLATRLSAAELPPPPGLRPSRLPWCGECDERTRMVGFYGDVPSPCPRCRLGPEPGQLDPAAPRPAGPPPPAETAVPAMRRPTRGFPH